MILLDPCYLRSIIYFVQLNLWVSHFISLLLIETKSTWYLQEYILELDALRMRRIVGQGILLIASSCKDNNPMQLKLKFGLRKKSK